MKLRLIGDIHRDIPHYLQLTSESDYSVQVGDLGFLYDEIQLLDCSKHRVIGGNHDNYSSLDGGVTFYKQTPHFLGDYGTLDFLPGSFYIRGARSIDKATRVPGVDWWPEEELRYSVLCEAIQAYSDLKPDIVISHECPAFLVNQVTRFKSDIKPSSTAHALEAMFSNHQPKAWFFGHYHRDWSIEFKGTYFRCLDIGSAFDVELPFNPTLLNEECLIPGRPFDNW